MNKSVTFLLSRFPTYRSRIIDEYSKNEEFKSLCDDLFISATALEERQRQLSIETQSELEYRRLFLDLESEFVRTLNREVDNTSAQKHQVGANPPDEHYLPGNGIA